MVVLCVGVVVCVVMVYRYCVCLFVVVLANDVMFIGVEVVFCF